jgi:hypothetical protein
LLALPAKIKVPLEVIGGDLAVPEGEGRDKKRSGLCSPAKYYLDQLKAGSWI